MELPLSAQVFIVCESASIHAAHDTRTEKEKENTGSDADH